MMKNVLVIQGTLQILVSTDYYWTNWLLNKCGCKISNIIFWIYNFLIFIICLYNDLRAFPLFEIVLGVFCGELVQTVGSFYFHTSKGRCIIPFIADLTLGSYKSHIVSGRVNKVDGLVTGRCTWIETSWQIFLVLFSQAKFNMWTLPYVFYVNFYSISNRTNS